MENFEELKKKVDAYPNSSLFVPLAEEYKKRGNLEEAMNVLKRGLERQPTYTSARVSLAKIYLEKGLRAEAVVELEKVVEASPENFFAHKKLADTYCLLGRRGDAVSQYNEVLRLNPEDEEAAENLRKLEGGGECGEDGSNADAASEIEALSMPPDAEEKTPPGAESTAVMDSPLLPDGDAVQGVFDGASVDELDPFGGDDADAGADEVWDVDDSDFDMGGLEFEPDGVYGDEDSGEVAERVSDAGIDISGEEETVQYLVEPEDDGQMDSPSEPDEFVFTGDVSGGEDILAAAEKVGHEILNEPGPEEPELGRESLVPSGGFEDDVSEEYSGESFIGNDDENVDVITAPGLETFEPEAEITVASPEEDKTAIMREPLAGMVETPGGSAHEDEATVIMEAPTFEQPAGVAPAVPEEEKTVIMDAPVREGGGADFSGHGGQDDGIVFESEPFASLDDTRAFEPKKEEPLTAEAGTIGDEFVGAAPGLINDPFAGMGGGPAVSEETVATADVAPAADAGVDEVEADALEPEIVEAEVFEAVVAEPVADTGAELARADGLIASGDLGGARRIYASLLAADPDNRTVRMKMEELMMLLQISGQGTELYINRLESFLAAITRRRDELRKNS